MCCKCVAKLVKTVKLTLCTGKKISLFKHNIGSEDEFSLPAPFLAIPRDPPILWANWLDSFMVYLYALGYDDLPDKRKIAKGAPSSLSWRRGAKDF